MVDSQPGSVTSFDPSLTLVDFSASSRDRFMFNENQLVLAKLQQPLPVIAAAVNRDTTNTITSYSNYLNLDGDFAYIDRSFQALDTPGVPTLPVHQIIVGYDQQITTSQVKFWSVGFVDTATTFVQYSFDNVTWFDAGGITWSQEFDDTIEINPGDSPPTGEFVYTGVFDSGNITARYWRIRSDAQSTVNGFSGTTATIANTSLWPSSSTSVVVLDSSGSYKGSASYTGKSSGTLTGWAGTNPSTSDVIININDPFGDQVTEVEVLQVTSAVLQHWNSDGTKAVTNAMEGSNYYDMAYDKSDDVYYAIRFDSSLAASSSIDPDDNFDDPSTGASFNGTKWIESSTNSYFLHNTTSGTLDMRSSGGRGQLHANYGVSGDFTVQTELVAAVELNENAYFSLELKDYTSNNQYAVSAIKGPYTPGVDTSGAFVGAIVEYSSTVGSAAQLQDFRIRPDAFTFDIGSGQVQYQLSYDSAEDHYTVTASGVTYPSATPGVTYTMDSAEFTVSNLTTPADGQGFTITVRCSDVPIAGTSTSGIQLQLERASTNSYARYEDTDSPGFNTLRVGNISSGATLRPQLYGDPRSQSVDVSVDNFQVTGGTIVFDSPVLSVVAIDKNGDITSVPGTADSEGYVLKVFDVIQDPQATYNDYLSPRVAIATNGSDAGSGGELYIKVNDSLYKYLKSSLPIDEDDGTGASVVTTGEIPSTGIVNFSYNGYTQGGLSYVQYLPDLNGVFVKSIKTTTMAASTYKALLDVDSTNYPFAWNVSDLSTLYFVDGTSLKLYDLNETKAGFVNVTSDKQVLAAGTSETATITGQVLNVYGEPKTAKTMAFSVSAGDGAISPASGCSGVDGKDDTTYTVGSAVGTATITVTVSDIVCTP